MNSALRAATLVLVALIARPSPADDDAAARSRALAKEAGEAWDCTLALLLAKEAVTASPTPEALTALYSALDEQAETTSLVHPRPPTSVAFSPDGAHVVTGCEDGGVRVWSVAGADEGTTKFERPVVRAWFLGGADRVLAATKGAAADSVDLAIWSRGDAGATAPLVAGAKLSDVAVSGDSVAAIGSDGQATLWDRDGKVVKTLSAATIEFAPTGGALLVRSADGKAQIVTTKGVAKELAFGRPATRATFAPSGVALVWGDDVRVAGFSADGRKVFDVKHGSAVEGAFANAQGNRLFVAGRGGYGLYDVPSGSSVRQWAKRGAFTCGAYCASSAFLFTIDGGRHCSVWLEDDKLFHEAELAADVREISPCRDGTRFFVRLADGTARAFDCELHPIFEKTIGATTSVVAWHPSSEWLLSATVKGGAELEHMFGRWPLPMRAHSGAVVDAAFTRSGDRAATASKDGTVRLWSFVQEGTETIGGFRGPCWYSNCSWTQERVVNCSWKTARISDFRGRKIASIEMPDTIATCYATDDRVAVLPVDSDAAQLYDLDGKLVGPLPHAGGASQISASRNGKKFAVWGTTTTDARLYDAKAKPLGAIDVGDRILGLGFDADGKRAVVSCASGRARIVAATAGAKPTVEFTPSSAVKWADFIGKGDVLISVGTAAAEAQLWTSKGKPLATLKGFAAAITNYGWTDAGDAVVLTSLDKTARVFDLTGRQTALLQHPDEVRQALFLPGDQRIVTSCKDGSARIWTRDGALVAEIKAHHDAACGGCGFDAKGEQLFTAGADFCARIWPATVEGLLAVATKRVCRGFTDDERLRYRALLR